MSRTEVKTLNDSIEVPLMKVNQVINSIFAMNQVTLVDQLQTCSKIVSQLLQNELINHINSLAAAKLLSYELVLMIAQQNAVTSRPRLSTMENAFGNNKKIRLTASMRNTLGSINQILQQIMWKNFPKKRGGTEKNIIENSALHQNYSQFKQLLGDFQRQIDEAQLDQNDQYISKSNKKFEPVDDQSSGQQNEALIEQLEQIVAKKQRRIKQLNQQLQQNILDQKAQQDLISQLQSRNIDLKQQIRMLNNRLKEKDLNQISLHQRIEDLMCQNIINQRESQTRKPILKTEKTIKTKYTDDFDQNIVTAKKQYKQLLEEKNIGCQHCEDKKDMNPDDYNDFRRMLLSQAICIESLI